VFDELFSPPSFSLPSFSRGTHWSRILLQFFEESWLTAPSVFFDFVILRSLNPPLSKLVCSLYRAETLLLLYEKIPTLHFFPDLGKVMDP